MSPWFLPYGASAGPAQPVGELRPEGGHLVDEAGQVWFRKAKWEPAAGPTPPADPPRPE